MWPHLHELSDGYNGSFKSGMRLRRRELMPGMLLIPLGAKRKKYAERSNRNFIFQIVAFRDTILGFASVFFRKARKKFFSREGQTF